LWNLQDALVGPTIHTAVPEIVENQSAGLYGVVYGVIDVRISFTSGSRLLRIGIGIYFFQIEFGSCRLHFLGDQVYGLLQHEFIGLVRVVCDKGHRVSPVSKGVFCIVLQGLVYGIPGL